MKVFKTIVLLAATLSAMLIMGQVVGCDCNCDPLDPLESGTYLVVPQGPTDVDPGDEWLVGAEIQVDRETEVAIIRYTREGTTYQVHYTLEWQ